MKDTASIYELRVALRDIELPIWRRLQVRNDVPLSKLHTILQHVMGWTNSHLHQFAADGRIFGRVDPELPHVESDRKMLLRQALQVPGDRLVYEYDFGDRWEHDVVLEQVLEDTQEGQYPRVIGGARECPPEDCGGPPGYGHLLEVLANPKDPEHEDLAEWVGGSFDAEAFDAGRINRALRRLV